jgi:hypothetical protein
VSKAENRAEPLPTIRPRLGAVHGLTVILGTNHQKLR